MPPVQGAPEASSAEAEVSRAPGLASAGSSLAACTGVKHFVQRTRPCMQGSKPCGAHQAALASSPQARSWLLARLWRPAQVQSSWCSGLVLACTPRHAVLTRPRCLFAAGASVVAGSPLAACSAGAMPV